PWCGPHSMVDREASKSTGCSIGRGGALKVAETYDGGIIRSLVRRAHEWLPPAKARATHASLHRVYFRRRVAANGAMSGFSVCRNPLLAKFSTRCSSSETSTSRRLLRP